jgi:hypothetical protein
LWLHSSVGPIGLLLMYMHASGSGTSAAITSTQGSRALPDQEKLASNQKSWPETAKLMGVKCVPKCRLPGEHGITEHSISALKKWKHVYTDAYAAGE